jgi:hypothetical protein
MADFPCCRETYRPEECSTVFGLIQVNTFDYALMM